MSRIAIPFQRAPGCAVAALLSLFGVDAKALCTVTCSCAVSTTNVVFGSINPLSLGNTDSVGGLSVTCAGVAGLQIPVQVDISKGSGASYASRSMAYGAYKLAYNLYQDSARSLILGDGTNGTVDEAGTLNVGVVGSVTVNFPVYGRVFGAQTTMPPGFYADTIAVTLTY